MPPEGCSGFAGSAPSLRAFCAFAFGFATVAGFSPSLIGGFVDFTSTGAGFVAMDAGRASAGTCFGASGSSIGVMIGAVAGFASAGTGVCCIDSTRWVG